MAEGASIVEEVADNLEEIAEATRRISGKGVGIFLGGVIVGAAVGLYFGYRYNREKLRAEAFSESEEEVDKIRQHYLQKLMVADAKPTLAEVIETQGYSDAEVAREFVRPLPAPVPVSEPRESLAPITEMLREPPLVVEHTANDIWDYAKEMEGRRDPDIPYVIHLDEINEIAEYDQVSYMYYAADDVICDTDDTPLPHADLIVGQDNLKFGHGSGDPEIVFVRNDKFELVMEITRSPKSYEEEVLGLEHSDSNDYERMQRHKRRFDDHEPD
jgi:hypothetical protein